MAVRVLLLLTLIVVVVVVVVVVATGGAVASSAKGGVVHSSAWSEAGIERTSADVSSGEADLEIFWVGFDALRRTCALSGDCRVTCGCSSDASLSSGVSSRLVAIEMRIPDRVWLSDVHEVSPGRNSLLSAECGPERRRDTGSLVKTGDVASRCVKLPAGAVREPERDSPVRCGTCTAD